MSVNEEQAVEKVLRDIDKNDLEKLIDICQVYSKGTKFEITISTLA